MKVRAALDRAGLAGDRAAGDADLIAGGRDVGDADREMAERAADLVVRDAVVLGQLDLGLLGIRAVADERERVFLLGPLGLRSSVMPITPV